MEPDVTERPILFSAPMVRAILDGRKSQTRRINVKDRARPYYAGDRLWVRETTIITPKRWNDGTGCTHTDADGDPRIVQYLATHPDREAADDYKLKATPSIFMPRWACRLTLDVAAVRVERLQEISEDDAKAEGARFKDFGLGKWKQQRPGWSMLDPHPWTSDACLGSARHAFGNFWNKLNEKRGFGWDANPMVWVVDFHRVLPATPLT